MHFISFNFNKNSTGTLLPTIFSTLIIVVLTISTSSATSYKSIANGRWLESNVWRNNRIAPEGIHKQDTIFINHRINANNLTITNGGTVIIVGELSAQSITLNGADSKIVMEKGAILNAARIEGNSQNIIYKDITPLPVTLVTFKLQAAPAYRHNNTLFWQTASELNNDYFSVEKSADGKVFSEAGRVKGKNLPNGASYTFEDQQVASRTYYRLKQVDFDGKATYSPIIVATAQQKPSIIGRKVVFGNSFSGQLRVLTLAGQEVRSLQLHQAQAYEMPQELRGMYMLILESGNAATSQRIAL
ncbi:hypothetical protein I5M27_14295 [Adhaeribacter sp. BT258]|uniref:G8 domain-containing protein n=1 Tax=Adhaeribacter terrigena TaxID=2793070 RepID=A0ABS1C479_9BACT|nr:hypothetical protein [Adhaeribacter terrigena]MBK0404162.1 hypothetical protein [Adhaeribacter terrigena]